MGVSTTIFLTYVVFSLIAAPKFAVMSLVVMLVVALKNIQEARKTIAPFIKCTPLVQSHFLTTFCRCPLFLKLENLQITGSFKPRGVFNKLLNLKPEKKIGDNHCFRRKPWSSCIFRRAEIRLLRTCSCA